MTFDSASKARTFTITPDYLSLEQAQLHAHARLSASPKTARDAAAESIRQLYDAQNGVLTGNQVAAITSAAHSAATANGASFDESAQQYRACCDLCTAATGQGTDEYETKYGYTRRGGKLYDKSGNEACQTCYIPRYMHDWVSTPNHHRYKSGAELTE